MMLSSYHKNWSFAKRNTAVAGGILRTALKGRKGEKEISRPKLGRGPESRGERM